MRLRWRKQLRRLQQLDELAEADIDLRVRVVECALLLGVDLRMLLCKLTRKGRALTGEITPFIGAVLLANCISSRTFPACLYSRLPTTSASA